jgi:WD40 repeat protein
VRPRKITNVAASADGKYLAVAPERAKTIEVFDMEAGKRLYTQTLKEPGGNVYISPDAKTLYVVEDEEPLRRFELVSGKELSAVADTTGHIDLIIASPDGKRLLTREIVERRNTKGDVVEREHGKFLVIHDAVANKTVGKLEVDGTPFDFGFAGPEAVIILAANTHLSKFAWVYTISRWNMDTVKREWEVPSLYLSAAYLRWLIVSPDGKRVAVTDRRCVTNLYDATTGKKLFEPSSHDAEVSWVGFSRDGERITTVAQDGVRTWTPTGERKSAASLPELALGRVNPGRFSEHLVWLAPTEDGKSAELIGWDREKSKIGWRMPLDDEDYYDRVLTCDGKRVVRLTPKKKSPLWDVTVYDGPAGKKLHTWSFKPPQTGEGGSGPTALSPDAGTLFIGGENGITAFDAATGKEQSRLDINGIRRVESTYYNSPLALSPDGSRIAIVTENMRGRGQTLRVYDVKAGIEVATHELGVVYSPGLRFSPNGKQVVVWTDIWGAAVQVCDAESSLTEPRKLNGGSCTRCVAFSPNSASLVVGYDDGTALVWDLAAK